MSKKKQRCYWCGKSSTSKEHVPPRCLFPEEKDTFRLLGKKFRLGLISVPSCDQHNLKKSHDDEYLLGCLSGKVGNNIVAYVHNSTKVKRARERNPKLVNVLDSFKINSENKEWPIEFVKIESNRLLRSFEAIGRGLFFYEYGDIFKGKITVLSEIFTQFGVPVDISRKNSAYCEAIQREQKFWGTEIKGENPEVFTYQFGPVDGFECQALILTFYEKTKVFVCFSNTPPEKMKLIEKNKQFLKALLYGIID